MDSLQVSERREWREWLEANHRDKKAVWLLFFKKRTSKPSLSYEDAIEEALSFGWIDGMVRRVDEERYGLRFTPRRPGSIWSKSNIARVEKLTREGGMTQMGIRAFEGRTNEISMAERFKIREPPAPEDLLIALKRNKAAYQNFSQFAPSYRKRYTMWLESAKTPETRRKRIEEAVELISRNVKSLLK